VRALGKRVWVGDSCGSLAELGDSHQIVGSRYQVGMHLHSLTNAIASAAQTSDGFHPAEGLLDPFAHPLTDGVTAMAHGARVKRRAAEARLILVHLGVTLSARHLPTRSRVS
jgi:hypothetical protein